MAVTVESGGESVDSSVETPSQAETERAEQSAIESNVAEKLEAAFADSGDEETDTKPEKLVGEGQEKDAEIEAAVEGEPEKEDEKNIAPVAKTSTLPAAYVRSLKAMEWTDEEIAEAEKNPNFVSTAAKLHQTRNQELSQWAALGRAKQQENATQQQNQPQQGLQPLKMADSAALKAKYGNDELIDSLTGPLNATVQQINAMLPAIQQMQQNSANSHLETLGRQVETFFGGPELKAYGDLYGASNKTLTPEQSQARNNMLQTADALIVGARMQGRTLSLNEALTLAHDSTSGGFKAKAARADVKSAMEKRGNGISLKPTGKKGISTVKAGDRGSFEKATKDRLAAAFAA